MGAAAAFAAGGALRPARPRAGRARFVACAARRPDTVAVIGATGGIGRVVVRRLVADGAYNVRAVSRSAERARGVLAEEAAAAAEKGVLLEFLSADVAAEGDARLRDALLGAEVVVIAVGTTAFPTRAWGKGFRNSPWRVDAGGCRSVVGAIDRGAVRRVVHVTSIGTLRGGGGIFWVLNLFGVLDAKRAGEVYVRDAAREVGFSYAVVRPGRLRGGPYTNAGELQRPDQPEDMMGIRVEGGDCLLGDMSRSAVAHIVSCTVDWPGDGGVEFCAVNVPGRLPSKDVWHASLDRLAQSVRLDEGGAEA